LQDIIINIYFCMSEPNSLIMIIYKFGGASVSSPATIENLAAIVSECDNKLFIVISAFGKTTNALEEILAGWISGNDDRFEKLEKLKDYHHEIISGLFPAGTHIAENEVDELFGKLEEKLRGNPSESYDYEYDQIVSAGELLSTKIVSLFLESRKIKNQWVDARKWLITDHTFREANVDFEESRVKIEQVISGSGHRIFITQGFIGGTIDGHVTTLGREGSDYTAAIAASLLDGEKLVVWKDVPGILTADPYYFPEAEKLDEISYQEAIELSFYGAKVIHPKTIKPLQNKNIPLYVKSFADPEGSGTIIHDINIKMTKPVLIIKNQQVLVSLAPRDFSFVVEDCLSRIFALFFKYRMKVNLLQHSAISFTICMDNNGPFVRDLLEELRTDYRVLYNEGLELVTIRHYNTGSIEKYIRERDLLVEQRSRNTVMFVVR
jgi:aspartate kinase